MDEPVDVISGISVPISGGHLVLTKIEEAAGRAERPTSGVFLVRWMSFAAN